MVRRLRKELPRVEYKIDYGSSVDLIRGYKWKELNLRQRIWLELLKDYDIDNLCHPGKANVVVDALSRKSMCSLDHSEAHQRPLTKEVHRLASLEVRLTDSSEGVVIVQNRAESSLYVEVKEKQYKDPLLVQLKEGIHKHKTMAFSLGTDDGTLRYQGQLCVPNFMLKMPLYGNIMFTTLWSMLFSYCDTSLSYGYIVRTGFWDSLTDV
ncbi:uncharacterized protein [Nicotiana tomentosiformis]|uniref:uncharacterized protein n=1 Tax=Nicotiana tomentosiformis TaxID=4098 RepID=UPI00388CE440